MPIPTQECDEMWHARAARLRERWRATPAGNHSEASPPLHVPMPSVCSCDSSCRPQDEDFQIDVVTSREILFPTASQHRNSPGPRLHTHPCPYLSLQCFPFQFPVLPTTQLPACRNLVSFLTPPDLTSHILTDHQSY